MSGATAVATPPPAPAVVVVDVVGAVCRPGVYRLLVGARRTPKAQLAAVNLAALLADGQQARDYGVAVIPDYRDVGERTSRRPRLMSPSGCAIEEPGVADVVPDAGAIVARYG